MSSKVLLGDLRAYTDRIVAKSGTPAISLAVWHDGRIYRAASGILNIESGVEATVDSVFQIGSISKVFTASLVMLLVDAGKVDLDRPIRQYLPGFHVADPAATETLTARHLLSHTSGLVSDSSWGHDDTDEDSSAITRYVDRCFLLPQVHREFGKLFSYSNAAYVMLGRLVEAVSGMSWRRAIEDYIFRPLSMTHALADPAQVLRFRAAMGHVLSGSASNKTAVVASRCYGPLAMAPTGSVLTMSASDLLMFAKAHLSGGKAESGAQWMSERSVRTMQEALVTLPAPGLMSETSWGIGWALSDAHGVRTFGHGGGTWGQQAFLQIIPECDSAFSIHVNGMEFPGAPVLHTVASDLLCEIAGVRPAKAPSGPVPTDAARFTGQFGSTGFRFEITADGNRLRARLSVDGSTVLPAQVLELKPVDANRFAAYTQDGEYMDDFAFMEPDTRGAPKYLFAAYRLHGRMP